jgi:hypothetical protein
LTQAASSGKRCWNSINERGKRSSALPGAPHVRDMF